jgi:hypothetical protein
MWAGQQWLRPLCFHQKAGQRIAWGRLCAGPNHELALVMTKERAGVMAEPSVLPLACSM